MKGLSYIKKIKESYNLELEKCIKVISKENPKTILLQFPDGLKPLAVEIYEKLNKEFKNKEFFIWAGSCFGACDIPNISNIKEIDLVAQWGHSEWNYDKSKNIKIVNV